MTERSLSRRSLVALAIGNAVVLLAGVVATQIVPRPVALTGPDQLAPDLPALQAFVERTRGRRFHYRVPIRQSDRLRAGPRRDAPTEEERSEARLEATVFLALGLVDEPYDPFAAQSNLDSQVLGAYSPRQRLLVVRPGPVTPLARAVLVHELTHALDDEYHELRRSETLTYDEADLSFRALAEGSATYVETQYIRALSPADRNAAQDENNSRANPQNTVPQILVELTRYPYEIGERFVTELVKRDGPRAIDRAFSDPPTTSEQLIHIDKYLAGEDPAPLPRPRPPNGAKVVERGALGELLLFLLLRAPVGVDAARGAAVGWGGGRYVAWSQGSDVCVQATLVMDTPKDADEAVAALRTWAAGRPRARVTPGTPITVDNCVPAGGA